MDALLAFFNWPLFPLLGEQVTVLELFGFVAGALW